MEVLDKPDTQSVCPPTPDYCREFLEPWVIRELPLGDPEARVALSLIERKYRRKMLMRKVKSTLSLRIPSDSFRTVRHVENAYQRIWSGFDWPQLHTDPGQRPLDYALWKDSLLLLQKGGLNQMGLERLCASIEAFSPARVLEIGFGSGINSLTLSAMFPDSSFTGIELSEAGVELARSVQGEAELPKVLADYCPRPVKDAGAHRRIEFVQANATKLPFHDNHFDLVFSRLALEQMQNVIGQALAEIRRVARGVAVLIEPFSDFNTTDLQKLSARSKDHFRLSVSDLSEHGLQPRQRFGDWPQKVSVGCGVAVASLMQR